MFYNILNGLLFWGIQSNIRESKHETVILYFVFKETLSQRDGCICFNIFKKVSIESYTLQIRK